MAGATVVVVKTGDTRVFTIEGRAGPSHAPRYQPAAAAGASSRSYGDVTQVQNPSADAYDQFDDIDQIRGERGRITVPIMARYLPSISEFMRMAEIGCSIDVHVPMGKCKDPTNFNLGWEGKKLVFEDVIITTHGLTDLGTLESSGRAVVNEEIDASARIRYEIKRLLYKQTAEANNVQEVVDIKVCDSPACGTCGVSSDGCQTIFALTLSAGGSPGLPAEVHFSTDGGLTWTDTNVDTLAANEDPDALTCVGDYLAVVSIDSDSIHIAPIVDVLDGTETWTEIATGIVASGSPAAIFSLGPRHTWIVGDGGYVYFTDDITAGVAVQDAGNQTVQNLKAIHGSDIENLVAVGASNAVMVTQNGGDTWAAITGPAVGVVLNTVFVKSPYEWWVGTAGGRLYYTMDSGETWHEKVFSGSGSGQVRHVIFATDSVGFMAHDTTTPAGRIFRTDDGGHTWYRDSEATNVALPANDRINKIAVCGRATPIVKANVIFAAGLDDNAADGIVIKGS